MSLRMFGKTPLFPHWPAPLRWTIGLGLLGLCLWLPAAIALFR